MALLRRVQLSYLLSNNLIVRHVNLFNARVSVGVRASTLTVLASECVLYPDGEEEPLLLPPIGGPGIPGILGTVLDDLASYRQTHIATQA